MLIDDPEVPDKGLRGEHRQEPPDRTDDRRMALTYETEHDDAEIVLRRELPHVGEVEVERQDGPRLSLTDPRHVAIGMATEPLLVDREGVVTILLKHVGDIRVQVFIDLESHHAAPIGNETTRSRASSAA